MPTMQTTTDSDRDRWVLDRLAEGWHLGKLMDASGLSNVAINEVAYQAETLPESHPKAQALARYKRRQQERVWNLLAEFKHHCQDCYGDRLVKLLLLGSCARCDFHPTSDIDVLVVLKDLNKERDRRLTVDFLMDTTARTSELISPLLYDEQDWLNGRVSLRRVISKEGIAI